MALRRRARTIGGMLLPRGIHEYRARRGREYVEALRAERLEAGREALDALERGPFSVDAAVAFLTSRGLDEDTVRAASVPQESLDYLATFVEPDAPASQALRALHIGNFVGVSLAFLSAALRAKHRESQVWSIDPNIAHRGVLDPAAHAIALLAHFGLLEHNLVLTGYTLEQSVGDDGGDPATVFGAERRPEQTLRNLARWSDRAYDIAFIDGNHEGRYLARELEHVARLLRPGGLLVLDDVDASAWQPIVDAFERLAARDGLEELGRDGRLGVLRAAG